MIHTDGRRTIANAEPNPCPNRVRWKKRPDAARLKELSLVRLPKGAHDLAQSA